MVVVYRKKNYVIYSNHEGYIIHNKNKEFSQGHTHINNFKTAKYLLDLAVYKEIPKRNSKYFFESLLRITNDNVYRNKLLRNMPR